MPKSVCSRSRDPVISFAAVIVCLLALIGVHVANAHIPFSAVVPNMDAFLSFAAAHAPFPVCDRSPGALTEAFAKLDITEEPQVVQHTCIERTGYPGERCFYTYVLECATVDSPLVYGINGVSLCPLWNFETSGWFQKAVENCFVVVWPVESNERSLSFLGFPVSNAAEEYAQNSGAGDIEGYEVGNEYETWGCCCNIAQRNPAPPSAFDDMTFLRNIAAVVVTAVAEKSNGAVTIDTKRIYMGGHSNGCSASFVMTAVHSDMVAAVCCHSPALVIPFPGDGLYSEPAVPIWLVHGKYDGTVRYYGAFNGGNNYIPGAEQTNKLLGIVNNCNRTMMFGMSNGNQTYKTIIQDDCDNGARVEFRSLENTGHTPFMGGVLFRGDLDGAEVTAIDTTRRAWEFCAGFVRAKAPVLRLVKPENSNGGLEDESRNSAPPRIPQENDLPASGRTNWYSVIRLYLWNPAAIL
mmetsp:Transcript_12474/g.31410  ORF Transcript_12474/g.31410 Transcript_12474/m.31410 type:complete len:465 (+) Transcript_12474:104-1498(+)